MLRFINILILPCLLAGVIFSQLFFDTEKSKAQSFEPNVLTADKVKMIDLGLHNAASDLMWLAAIQYLGGAGSKGSPKLGDYLFASTELDSQFSYPYAFGVLMLPMFGSPDKAIELGKKGLKDAEPDWRIPYYMAATYHSEMDNPVEATKYFDIAANTKGAPDNIKWVAANYGTRPDKRERTKNIWIGIMSTTDDEVVRERAKNYVMHYEIIDLLENAAKAYHEKNKKYPDNLEALITSNILRAIPPDPFGSIFKVDGNGRVTAE